MKGIVSKVKKMKRKGDENKGKRKKSAKRKSDNVNRGGDVKG